MFSVHASVWARLAQVFDGEEGQGLTEYALILGLVALIAIGALTMVGGSVSSELSTVANSV
jgi:pilus assembly protein Flp/PilA